MRVSAHSGQVRGARRAALPAGGLTIGGDRRNKCADELQRDAGEAGLGGQDLLGLGVDAQLTGVQQAGARDGRARARPQGGDALLPADPKHRVQDVLVISPLGLGLVSTFLIYWVQYGTVVYLHKRPKKILDHFAAADTQRDFYGAFLIANAFAFSFFVMFSTTPANPMCGPLRSVECYEGAKLGNLTACAADAVAQRKNYNWLSDTLLPVDDSQPQAVFALAAGNNTQPVAPVVCDAVCRAKYIFQIGVSTQVLLPLALFFVVLVTFVSAAWARNARELREARKELAIEYQDKKMLARYARVEI